MLTVLGIGVAQYLKFLEETYGVANLDGFEIRTTGVSTPEIRVYRSKIQEGYNEYHGSDEYVFRDAPNSGYVVTWTSPAGERKNISKIFEDYIRRNMAIDKTDESSYEM